MQGKKSSGPLWDHKHPQNLKVVTNLAIFQQLCPAHVQASWLHMGSIRSAVLSAHLSSHTQDLLCFSAYSRAKPNPGNEEAVQKRIGSWIYNRVNLWPRSGWCVTAATPLHLEGDRAGNRGLLLLQAPSLLSKQRTYSLYCKNGNTYAA